MNLILYSILLLIAANLTNVHIDAYKILHLHKLIKHSINLIAYAAVTLLCILLTGYAGLDLVWFCLLSFSCRQVTFDIPLNWRRGLKWDYVTTADPPGAVMDRIEIYVFGRNGKIPVYVYLLVFTITLIILIS